MATSFDMDALRTMVVGTELGSFARAASRLGRSQSAVSMQLKKLEEQAGKPLFYRNGRGLVPTEAGDALLAYARRIVALNDEAATSIGATASSASVRMGLPQDFFEDIMPDALAGFSQMRPGMHVEVRAGRNHVLEAEVVAGRIDVAIAFFAAGSDGHGELIASLPMAWLACEQPGAADATPLPLILFDHPCLFRQSALKALDRAGQRWRLALTTPSLSGVWAAVRLGHGVTARTRHRVPAGVLEVGRSAGLPDLPAIELRLLTARDLSPAAQDLREIVESAGRARLAQA